MTLKVKKNGVWDDLMGVQWKQNNVWSQNSDFPPPPAHYVLATDDDFEQVGQNYRYIGTDEYVIIPQNIDGSPITRFNRMFLNSFVRGVYFNNKGSYSCTQMFAGSKALSIELITNMTITSAAAMFSGAEATEFNFEKTNFKGITNANSMFSNTKAQVIDLSTMDTSTITNSGIMFLQTLATVGYARTQADADFLNNTDSKPAGLTFVVKP